LGWWGCVVVAADPAPSEALRHGLWSSFAQEHPMLVIFALLALTQPASAGDCPELETVIAALDSETRCLTPAIRSAWLAAETPEQQACVAEAMHLRGMPASPMAPGRPFEGERAPLPDPAVRDSYGLPNQAFSEHFVVLWGDNDDPSQGRIDNLLTAFETGWNNHIETWGMPAPVEVGQYYFNVYIGNSGSGAPGISGASGYFTTDGDGYPIIVMDPDTLSYSNYAATTAVHEFFHACQWATGNYITQSYMWFWEATATWSEGSVYPHFDDYAWPLPGFAFLPHLPLSFFDYPDRGQLQEMHHYGAFVWPRYISEYVADDILTVNVWKSGSAGSDPLFIYDDLVYRASGLDLMDVWGDFLAHNAVWDYADHDLYVEIINMYDNYYTDESIAASYTGDGMEAWGSARENLPQSWGANYIVLVDPSEGELRFAFEGASRGSEDSLAEWEIRMVLVEGGAYTYVDVPVEGGVASWASAPDQQIDTIYAVIGAWAATNYDGETFDYDYRLWVAGAFDDTGLPDDTSSPEEPGGCGCASGPGAGAAGLAWLGLLGIGAAVRRRRG
jgi:MYXO-CTERM domain-containing protein